MQIEATGNGELAVGVDDGRARSSGVAADLRLALSQRDEEATVDAIAEYLDQQRSWTSSDPALRSVTLSDPDLAASITTFVNDAHGRHADAVTHASCVTADRGVAGGLAGP